MFSRFFYAIGGLLPHHISPQIKALYGAMTLQSLALAMLMLFEPIYLWQLGFSLSQIIWFFVGGYVLYLLLMPLGAKFATQFGYEHSMVLSTVAQVGYYACL